MSFRTVIIDNQSKLSYKNNYLVVRTSDDIKSIHIDEINTLIVNTTAASITSYLITEMVKNKINIIFCDEYKNPIAEVNAYYGSHNTSKKIDIQTKWTDEKKGLVWKSIVKQKIINQMWLLNKINHENKDLLLEYANNITFNDETNREGHAARAYFYGIFGSDFGRSKNNDINAALNYGYAILLSAINREVVANGYLTQIGIKHKNEFNNFNLSSDLIEPFRVIVDVFVYSNLELSFDKEYKIKLINLLNNRYLYNNKEYLLNDILKQYIKNVLDVLNDGNINNLKEFNMYEGSSNEEYYIF